MNYRGDEKSRRNNGRGVFSVAFERVGRFGSRIKERARAVEILVVLRGIALGGAAFLLSGAEIYFGAAPFGIALLSATPTSIVSVALGMIVHALSRGGEGGIYCVATLVTVGLRILAGAFIEPPRGRAFRDTLFCESAYLRMATAAVAAFCVGLYELAVGGFYVYDLGKCITATVCAPVATALFMPLFEKNAIALPEKESTIGKVMHEVAYFALCFALTLSARAITINYFLPFHIATTALTLYTVRNRGLARGALVGFICGAVGGLESALLYAAAAAASTLFLNISLLAAATVVPVCGAIWCVIFGDGEGFVTLFPSQVCGLVLFCAVSLAVDRLFFGTDKPGNIKASAESGESARLRGLSAAFSDLADTFSSLAKVRRRPSESELREATDRVCDRVCLNCKNRGLCWNVEYASTLDMITKLCATLRRRGFVEVEDLPPHIKKRCPSLSHIVDGVNSEVTKLLRTCLEDDRLSSFAADYKTVAIALAQASVEEESERRERTELSEKTRRVLQASGIRFSSVSVTGCERLQIKCVGVDISGARVRAVELRERIEEACGASLTPVSLSNENGKTIMSLSSRRTLSVECGAARSSAKTGERCGDSICSFENDGDLFYLVICDGMGHGEEAAFVSNAALSFITRMLRARMSVDSTVELLGAWLRADRQEMSVSIDILELDLTSGRASLYKSGAATTYLCRDGRITPIDSPGLPVGIMKQTVAHKTELVLRAGDRVLMGSDGIDPEGRVRSGEEGWLLPLISGVSSGGATTVAERIVRSARQAGSRDDIGAAVLIVGKETG